MSKLIFKHTYFFIVIYGIAVLFSFLGNVHLFDWDEANFAELAREMILTKNYLQPQINYLPFYEKPPIFIWFQVASMRLFGVNEFAARFPNAVLGILVMMSLYWIGKNEHDSKFGRLWVLTYIGSFLPFIYFRTGLIDPWFNYFMFLSLYFYYNTCTTSLNKVVDNKLIGIVISALFLGLAVQTKGPVALILVYGTIGILWIVTKFKSFPGIFHASLWFFFSLFFSSLWFLYETFQHGTGYIYEFIFYQIRLLTTEDALHGGPIYYHVIVLLLGCFPASIFLFNKEYKNLYSNDFGKIMIICGLVVLILFSIVQTKIIHYSSMAYFPISYIAARYLAITEIKKLELKMIYFLFIILAFILVLLPILGFNLKYILSFISNVQTVKQLSINVTWNYIEIFWGIGFMIFLYITYVNIQSKYLKVFIVAPTFILIFWIGFADKIETYVQGELISFYKSMKNENVDIKPLYIKSYACFFYADKKPFENDTAKDHIHYLYNNLDRPVYFILRDKDAYNIDTNTIKHIQKIREAAGYTIFFREKNKN